MERDKMDTFLNFNSKQLQKDSSSKDKTENAGVVAQNSPNKLFKTENENETVETAGTVAQNNPSPLFSTQTETAGTIACNTNGSSSSSGGSLSALG